MRLRPGLLLASAASAGLMAVVASATAPAPSPGAPPQDERLRKVTTRADLELVAKWL